MELRKDPITRSWVRIGHGEKAALPDFGCPLCPAPAAQRQQHQQPPAGELKTLLELPCGGSPQVRIVPHFHPLYTIEGDANRLPEGFYDRMHAVGAHEIVIESPDHNLFLGNMRDDEIACVLEAYAARILDLKRDPRFKYVTVAKNRGVLSGAEFSHSYSEVTATMFVPRRVLYELQSARAWYAEKERCLFCDILRQEERQSIRIVDVQGDYVALCPFASRVPYEIWLMPRPHNHLFEKPLPGSNRAHLAGILGRTLRRLSQVSESFHLVLHTAPSTVGPRAELAPFWQTLAEDFHWHIEILPIVENRSKSYSIKEIYFNALLPEQAAEQLRRLPSAV